MLYFYRDPITDDVYTSKSNNEDGVLLGSYDNWEDFYADTGDIGLGLGLLLE